MPKEISYTKTSGFPNAFKQFWGLAYIECEALRESAPHGGYNGEYSKAHAAWIDSIQAKNQWDSVCDDVNRRIDKTIATLKLIQSGTGTWWNDGTVGKAQSRIKKLDVQWEQLANAFAKSLKSILAMNEALAASRRSTVSFAKLNKGLRYTSAWIHEAQVLVRSLEDLTKPQAAAKLKAGISEVLLTNGQVRLQQKVKESRAMSSSSSGSGSGSSSSSSSGSGRRSSSSSEASSSSESA